MRKLNLLCLIMMLHFCSQAQTPIYFNFVSHNEESSQWNASLYYTNNRARLITLSNYFNTKGITWNMQSDWVYLTNVLTQESPTLMLQTNNKNILRWMHEDKGVEMDPHAHESQYIYPDVVKLMDSIGLPESKVIGGTIYNDSNGVNIWTNLVNGQYGIIFPNKFWKPNYMMGGGTPNHLSDLKYYGLWNPQSPSNYLINDTSVHLTHLGVGCSLKISDTTNVNDFVAGLHDLVQAVQTGHYPTNGFYIQTIFFEQGDLNTLSFYNKVIEIADSAQAIVSSGAASWKTFKEAYTLWENNYNKQAFQWQCGQVATDVTSITKNLPQLKISWCSNSLLMIQHLSIQDDLLVIDISGRVWKKIKSPNEQLYIDVSSLASGMYFVKNGTTTQTFVKN